MKKVFYILAIVVLSIIIIFNLCSILDISFFNYRIFKVVTGSMEPNIKIGDVVLIKKEKNYKIGDIVTYKHENNYITHRIVAVKGNKIITKGDANNTNDEAINKKDVVGKMILKLTVLSYINYLIGYPIVWVLLFIIGMVVILVMPNYKKKNGKIIDEEIL